MKPRYTRYPIIPHTDTNPRPHVTLEVTRGHRQEHTSVFSRELRQLKADSAVSLFVYL